MKFTDLYLSNLQSVKSSLTSLWCSEASTDKQKGYAEQLKELIDNEIFSSEDYEPLVQSMELYESSAKEETKEIFKTINESLWQRCQEKVDRTNGTFSLIPKDNYFPPYKHQVKAWESLTAPDCRSMVVTTGTGSGKTECFMVPLVNELLNSTDNTHSVKAIFLYPLNALMEDQKERLQKLLDDGGNRRLTFAVYNGNLPDRKDQDNEDDIEKEKRDYPNIVATRNELHRNSGADIILTNPTMLEYMLIRDKDQHLFSTKSLRWIVIDEAHTFTGAAATELAMLLRRLLNAFGTDKDQLHFAASSATIGNSDDKAEQERKLKRFISDISGISPQKIDVIKGERNKYKPTEDSEFSRCKIQLTEVGCDYIKLSELLPNYKSTEERLKKLDEYCDQNRKDGDCLRAKVHFFYRVANSGIRVQLDTWEDKERGLLKLQSHMPKAPQATPALEVVRCNHCGEYIAIGEFSQNDPQHYRTSSDTDEDLFDLNSEKTNKIFFGVVPTSSKRKEGNEYVSINGNEMRTGVTPSGDYAIVVNTDRLCPHCSAKLYPNKNDKGTNSAQSQDDVEDDTKFRATRLRISAEFIARLMAPGLLDCMKPKDGSVDVPHRGQQYISFVDSRQAAAKGTFQQNVEVERDWVYSRVFHKLLESTSELNITKQKQLLATKIQNAQASDDWDSYGQLSAELAKLNAQYPNTADKDYLEWIDIYNLLKDDPTCNYLCRQFANQTNDEVDDDGINPAVKDRYIFAIMLSNLAKYPPFQASAETMGLLMSYYPKLDRITELPIVVEDFFERYLKGIESSKWLTEWKNLLKIYLDRTPRSNESIYLKIDSLLHCDIFNCSERFGLQRPPHRTARKPFVNEKCNNISLIPLLLAKVINPNSGNLLDVIRSHRDDINKIIDAMWKDLTETTELLRYSDKIKDSKRKSININNFSTNDWEADKDSDEDTRTIPKEQQNVNGYQLRLNVADIAFKVPEHVFYCEIPEKGGVKTHKRPTYTTFCGYSPYPDSNIIKEPFSDKEWSERYKYIKGLDENQESVSFSIIESWLRENRSEMYEYGLLGENGCFNTRVLSILSYPNPFIQAEHTAQVEKRLSRKTQELFKAQKLNILACSTTMEMGVDLGNLELVVMASIPPHPANYKQRAGRSGRNDATRSACITLCSSDAVGARVLRDPMQNIINRKVEMPFVDWDSPTIIQRHVNAFLYRQSGIFFSDDNRSSLNWSLIDIFTNYHFHIETKNKNGRTYHYENIWDLRDSNNNPIFPKEMNPLGDPLGTKYEKFALWIENKAQPSEVEFLLKDTDYYGRANDFIDKCSEEWEKRYTEIERELSYYGKQYEEAYQEAVNNNSGHAKPNRELDNGNGRRLLIKFNTILEKRLIDYLATHRFTPNANMPVDVVEFDIYHNKKDLNKGKTLLSNPSYSLQQALSQYAPGNMVVKENRVIRVAGAEYYGKDTAHDKTTFYTDGEDVVGSESEKSIEESQRKVWPVNGKTGLDLVLVKSFIPDINAQDSRVLDSSPYTTVNAYLVGTEDWNASKHHLISVRCNLDAGEAKIMYYNDGIGYGYCMCPTCGKMELESAPCPSGGMKRIPTGMISELSKTGIPCHYAIDRTDDNGKPKHCIPPKNRYYRNVIIGGLIQTDFCEMRIKKVDNTPASKTNDKSLLTTLGLVICRAFTEYIGKDRNSVDFTIMLNGNLCIFDTNPGGSGYSNKLSDSHDRLTVIKKSKEMLDNISDKEELLDKFTVRYLNDIDIDTTKEWLDSELSTWDNTPDNVKNSNYSLATWANILDILKDFKEAPNGGTLFCNDEFDKWNYSTADIANLRHTWEHRIQNIIKNHSIGSNKVDLLIPTDKTIPTQALSVLPQNGWVSIYSTNQHMENGFYPLACVNGHLYFTDEPETASMNGDWAKGSVFCIAPDKYDFSQKLQISIKDSATTCVFYLNTDETKKCNSTELAEIVLNLTKEKGLKIDKFFQECKKSNEIAQITYLDEHLKSVTGMITTMHFIDTILDRMGRKDNFHVKFVNEKYYTASYEVNTPWLCIEKWERRNSILEKLANTWIESKYEKPANEAKEYWENDCQNEKSSPHWRVLTIECGKKMLNIYPHGGIINEWMVDREAEPRRYFSMDDTTEKPIPLVRENPIMYIVEVIDK